MNYYGILIISKLNAVILRENMSKNDFNQLINYIYNNW